MEAKVSRIAKSFKPSPIQELSLLAQGCNSINLAEGSPDFPAPFHLKNAAISAINSDFNQYRLFVCLFFFLISETSITLNSETYSKEEEKELGLEVNDILYALFSISNTEVTVS